MAAGGTAPATGAPAGATHTSGPSLGGAAPNGGAAAAAAGNGSPTTTSVAEAPAAPMTGLAAARAALANRAARQANAKTPPGTKPAPPAGAKTAAAPTAWSDGSPTEEAPYDPDYDGPAKAAAIEGFDPGDEPLDDVIDEKTARQSSEQQAMQLLRDAFGAEKIGES